MAMQFPVAALAAIYWVTSHKPTQRLVQVSCARRKGSAGSSFPVFPGLLYLVVGLPLNLVNHLLLPQFLLLTTPHLTANMSWKLHHCDYEPRKWKLRSGGSSFKAQHNLKIRRTFTTYLFRDDAVLAVCVRCKVLKAVTVLTGFRAPCFGGRFWFTLHTTKTWRQIVLSKSLWLCARLHGVMTKITSL
jgi:hypothetical protein